ncbi:MAG: nitroreductase family protein [Deltaproteobacteria bacterium]|nr:nitroreductase family protein [Deltaproteobacteria bacterium]
MIKHAVTEYPVQDFIARRWSPYGFANREVSEADLRSLFEAARWAASSFNEQPWSYIVATRAQETEFSRLLSCLVEANQEWAKAAPILALGVTTHQFARNGKPNRVALHDLGLATGNLVAEATARGLSVHQMGGILQDRAREIYGIPDGSEAVTGMAIGYASDPDSLPEEIRRRDLSPRTRKPQREFVFHASWREPF